jgi:hypothetical protein
VISKPLDCENDQERTRLSVTLSAIDGRMTCACQILIRGSPVRLAAGVVPMSGRGRNPSALVFVLLHRLCRPDENMTN